MCIRDSNIRMHTLASVSKVDGQEGNFTVTIAEKARYVDAAVSYTHLRAHETVLDLVCRLLLEKKKQLQIHTLSESTV